MAMAAIPQSISTSRSPRPKVRSWTPLEGAYHGFLITHGESISISDHLTVWEDGEVTYRPTVHYAYYPCDDAVLSLHELAGRNWPARYARRSTQARAFSSRTTSATTR